MNGEAERPGERVVKIEEEVGHLQRAEEELVKQMLEMEKRLREVTGRVERLERGLERLGEVDGDEAADE